jgi:NAD-dependent SIR2 family protein deacetylase
MAMDEGGTLMNRIEICEGCETPVPREAAEAMQIEVGVVLCAECEGRCHDIVNKSSLWLEEPEEEQSNAS